MMNLLTLMTFTWNLLTLTISTLILFKSTLLMGTEWLRNKLRWSWRMIIHAAGTQDAKVLKPG